VQTSSSTHSLQTARPPAAQRAPAPAGPGNADRAAADGVTGEAALFADLVAQAGARQGAAQEAQAGKAKESTREPRDPAAGDVILLGMVPAQVEQAARPAGSALSTAGGLPASDAADAKASASAAAEAEATATTASQFEGIARSFDASPTDAEAASASPAGATADATADAPTGADDRHPAVAAARDDKAAVSKPGSVMAEAMAAATAGRAAAAASAGRDRAAATESTDADRASRGRRAGREPSVVAIDRTMSAGRSEAAALVSQAAAAGGHVADALAAPADGQLAGVAAASPASPDNSLFALTMNQANAAAGAATHRQEMVAGTTADLIQGTIDVPVDHADFADAFARQSASLVVQGSSQAEIRLTPQDMGPIRIAISLDGDGALLDIEAAHADTRAAIEASMPQLRQMLADQGVRLADWRLREESSGDSRQAFGGESNSRHGEQADGSRADSGRADGGRSDSGPQVPADADRRSSANGEHDGRGHHPLDRWATAGGPPAAATTPVIGSRGGGAAGPDRRLDLYA
jgi:flagellar hook-length control protein FliK